MADEDWLDGVDGFSDDSDFYGSEKTQKRLEKKARRAKVQPYEQHPFVALVKPELPPSHSPWANDRISPVGTSLERTHHASTNAKRDDDYENVYSVDAPSSASKEAKLDVQGTPVAKQENVLDFLKSRPQLATLRDASKFKTNSIKEGIRKVSGEATDDRVPNDRFKGKESAWQQHETVLEFLRRLPVAEPRTAAAGPWLWVGSSLYRRSWNAQDKKFDLDAFMEQGASLFVTFDEQRTKIEQQNPGKPMATVTRKLGPHRDVLEENILSTAVNTGVTSGKWMLFPLQPDLPRVWRTVAEATAAGKLGPTSKVGTYEPENAVKGTLICVYTYNFADFDDVRRVLHELVDLNLVGGQMRTIYYKCDAYTYLDLGSTNPYKIKASLYSSKDVLENEVKVREDGVVARLSKKNRTMKDYLR